MYLEGKIFIVKISRNDAAYMETFPIISKVRMMSDAQDRKPDQARLMITTTLQSRAARGRVMTLPGPAEVLPLIAVCCQILTC